MNYKKLPKQEEVQQFQVGNYDISVVKITDENKEYLLEQALGMYANEPCRICGELLTLEDIKAGAIFAGYSQNNESRSAHKECWNKNIPQAQWAYPRDSK